MRDIYTNGERFRRVSGISYTYGMRNIDNRFYRNQSFQSGYVRKKEEHEKQTEQNSRQGTYNRIYKSTDPNIIYFREYCRVRNTLLYKELNHEIDDISRYRSRTYYDPISKYIRMLEAYGRKDQETQIIDFSKRKKEIVLADKQEKDSEANTSGVKRKMATARTKSTTAHSNASRTSSSASKKQEGREFRESLKPKTVPNSAAKAYDDAILEFEKVLNASREYRKTTPSRSSTTVSRTRTTRTVSRATTTRTSATAASKTRTTTTTPSRTRAATTTARTTRAMTTAKKTTTKSQATKKTTTSKTTTVRKNAVGSKKVIISEDLEK